MGWTPSVRGCFLTACCAVVFAYLASHPTLAYAEDCPASTAEPCSTRYRPVCARWDTGIRCVRAPCPSIESRLYTNACLACRDDRVRGFESGECPERSEPEVGRRYEIALDPFVRRFDNQSRRSALADVDLEVGEPVSVLQAWIRLEGDAFPGSAELTDPGQGVAEVPMELRVAVEEDFDEGVISVGRPVALLGPFDGFFKAEARLGPQTPRYSGDPWAALSDGRAQLQLSFAEECPASCLLLRGAVIEVRRAVLVIDVLAGSDVPQRED